MVRYSGLDRLIEARDLFKNKVSSKSLTVNTLFLLTIGLSIITMGCGKFKADNESDTGIVTDKFFANQLKSSPERIVVAGAELKLSVYFWRDFMPVAEENGSPLIGSIRYIGQSGNSLLNSVSISKVYVINGNQIWICDPYETRIIDNDVFEVIVRNGPKWGPGINVDVVCEFTNQGKSFRLICRAQRINRTD